MDLFNLKESYLLHCPAVVEFRFVTLVCAVQMILGGICTVLRRRLNRFAQILLPFSDAHLDTPFLSLPDVLAHHVVLLLHVPSVLTEQPSEEFCLKLLIYTLTSLF